MHFSKTYTQLLLSLPPDLRENAIEYRQLKKLINQIVRELESLGLSPAVLQKLLENSKREADQSAKSRGKAEDDLKELRLEDEEVETGPLDCRGIPRAIYEVTEESGRIEPQLRLWVDSSSSQAEASTHSAEESASGSEQETEADADGREPVFVHDVPRGSGISLLWALQRRSMMAEDDDTGRTSIERPTSHITEVPYSEELDVNDNCNIVPSTHGTLNEVVVPLVYDMAFFQMLSDAIETLSAHLAAVHSSFVDTLETLSRTISASARPTSSTKSFHPYSLITSDASAIKHPAGMTKSDLYSWREIFQLYIEAEVFESVSEASRGERSVEESEQRLKIFAERIAQRGLGDGRKLKLQQSREALETFLELNVFILNIKKFQFANAEATRKILKKHNKRTALSFYQSDHAETQALFPRTRTIPLPRVLVQAIGETLLPIIPHLDDYACLICTSIAFKPIRLNCGHLFCVRCLVKMQKRGDGHCPMCRAPSVLTADGSNVDWALLNFMQDWFPLEAKEKMKSNEKEAAREELEELGIDPDQTCIVM